MKEGLRFLGILNKAGKLLFGAAATRAVAKASAMVLADDCAPNTKKAALPGFNGLLLTGVSKAELGSSLGYDELSVVLVMDHKASKALAEKWRKGE